MQHERHYKSQRGEGLCGPRAPAPGDFISWTSIAEAACLDKPTWFPLLCGGTRKPGFVPWCFWPGGEAANPDALHPGKARESSVGESLLSPTDFPRLSWARSPQTFRTPSAAGGACLLIPTMFIRQLRVQGPQDPGWGLGRIAPAFPFVIQNALSLLINQCLPRQGRQK